MSEQQFPFPIPIAYPEPDFKITNEQGKQLIWDAVRKKKIVLTPEEWVRQNFIQYLIHVLNYPSALMAIEKEIRLASRKKRCDIVVYQDTSPWMIVECKEPGIPLNEKVLQQILTYNMVLQVPFLVLTNGPQTFAVQSDGSSWKYLKALPILQ